MNLLLGNGVNMNGQNMEIYTSKVIFSKFRNNFLKSKQFFEELVGKAIDLKNLNFDPNDNIEINFTKLLNYILELNLNIVRSSMP